MFKSFVNTIILEDTQAIIDRNPELSTLFNKSILITGASGFIAGFTVDLLMQLNLEYNAGISVFALARNEEKFWERFECYKGNPLFRLVHSDVTSIDAQNIDFEIDIIIHAASHASPKFYGSDPVGTLTANTIGTFKLLELAKLKGVETFLFVSSAEVYGQPSKTPTSEMDYGYLDPINVRSCYAESKRMGENMSIAWMNQFSVPVKIVRPFHTYGPGMSLDDGRVYADFIRNVVNEEEIVLNSSGVARRAFCYLADAVEGLLKVLIQGETGEAYNLGNDQGEISIVELAKLLEQLYPDRVPSIQINAPASSGYITSNVDRACPSIEKIKALGWQPRLSVKDGFIRTIESYLNEP